MVPAVTALRGCVKRLAVLQGPRDRRMGARCRRDKKSEHWSERGVSLQTDTMSRVNSESSLLYKNLHTVNPCGAMEKPVGRPGLQASLPARTAKRRLHLEDVLSSLAACFSVY